MASKSQEGRWSRASSNGDEFRHFSYGLHLLAKMIARRHMDTMWKRQKVREDDTSGLKESDEAKPKDEGNEY